MPGLYSISKGRAIKFDEALHGADFDAYLVDVVIERPDLAAGMTSWLREQLVPSAAGGRVFDGANLVGWHGEPQEQLANLRRWNSKRKWGFSKSDFPAAPRQFLPVHEHDVLVLVAYLPDRVEGGRIVPGHVRTYNEYCEIIQIEQPEASFHAADGTADTIRLLAGTEERHAPGIRWMVVDLGANSNSKPADVRDASSAHAEVLAAFAQMPGYIQAMRWFNPTKGLWLAGYEVTGYSTSKPAWSEVPEMSCHEDLDLESKRYWLNSNGADSHSRNTFAPTTWPL